MNMRPPINGDNKSFHHGAPTQISHFIIQTQYQLKSLCKKNNDIDVQALLPERVQMSLAIGLLTRQSTLQKPSKRRAYVFRWNTGHRIQQSQLKIFDSKSIQKCPPAVHPSGSHATTWALLGACLFHPLFEELICLAMRNLEVKMITKSFHR